MTYTQSQAAPATYPDRNYRRHARVTLSSSVIVIAPGEVRTLAARDVGAGGIYLYSDAAPSVGAPVVVEFVTGRLRRFSVSGVVLRRDAAAEPDRPAGFAVTFDGHGTSLDARARALAGD